MIVMPKLKQNSQPQTAIYQKQIQRLRLLLIGGIVASLSLCGLIIYQDYIAPAKQTQAMHQTDNQQNSHQAVLPVVGKDVQP